MNARDFDELKESVIRLLGDGLQTEVPKGLKDTNAWKAYSGLCKEIHQIFAEGEEPDAETIRMLHSNARSVITAFWIAPLSEEKILKAVKMVKRDYNTEE